MNPEKLSRIAELRRNLMGMGYYRFQVEDMIKDIIGAPDLSTCSGDALDEVIASLEEQLAFARQCQTGPEP